MTEFLGGEAASLREAPLPPDPSLPKSGWRLGWDDSSELVPPERWEWFPASWLSPRRLTEPPRTCGVGGLDREKADGVCHRLSLYRRMRWAGKVYAEREKGSLCGESLLAYPYVKPPLKGEVPAICGRRGSNSPRCEGRGGSVSRRDHNQVYRRPPLLSGGTTYAEANPPNASRSSGEGVWGRGASLREAASPPESPSSLPRITRAPSSRSLSLRALW